MEQAQMAAHNAAVAELWDGYGRGANRRVPLTFACDESLWLREVGRSYREFYSDPRVQIEANLAGQAWMLDNVLHDQRIGPPEGPWHVTPRFWMAEPEYFGCEVRLQDHSFAWARPLEGSKGELLARVKGVAPRDRIQQGTPWRLWTAMRELAEGMSFRGQAVTVGVPGEGIGTHGLFTIACHVRGVEALCMDLAQDPGFADEFLAAIARATVERMVAWRELAGSDSALPMAAGWGMADDSIQLLSAETYRRQILPHHQWLYSTLTTGTRHLHLCGHSQQHYPALYHELGIRALDGPGPFVDHGAMLAAMPELTLSAQVDHTVLLLGPESGIEAMLRSVLTDAAKQPGRYTLMGYLGPQTPMRHVETMYEAGKRWGAIPPDLRGSA